MNKNSNDKNDENREKETVETLCEYCKKPMSKYDYETYHGLCGTCREIADWKEILRTIKEKQ